MFNGLLHETTTILIMRLIIAAFLGALIGIERDMHGRAAGLRTHMLVSLGSALFMILSESIVSVGQIMPGNWVRIDPGRIAAQVVTGIGFIGAGAIIKEGFTIRGLTTASCLWVAAAIGMASGSGNYKIAVSTTLIALLSLIIFKRFERIFKKDIYRIVTIITKKYVEPSFIIDIIKKEKFKILHFDFKRDYEKDISIFKFTIRLFYKGSPDKLSHIFIKEVERANIEVKLIEWNHRE